MRGMTKIPGKRGRAPGALHRPSLQQSCSTHFDCCRQGPKQRQYRAETRQRIWKISKRADRFAPKWPTFRSRTRKKNSGKKKVPVRPRSQLLDNISQQLYRGAYQIGNFYIISAMLAHQSRPFSRNSGLQRTTLEPYDEKKAAKEL